MIKKFVLLGMLIVATFTVNARTIELVLPYAPGGPADRLAQLMLPILKDSLDKNGITPVISFKPGGGTTIGAQAVAKTEPGKIQILLMSNSIVQAPIINKLPNIYNIEQDFRVLGYLGHLPMLMVVNINTNIQNFNEFRKLCQQGKLTYGTGGIGTSGHISTAIISNYLGCDAPAGHFKGLGPMLTALVGNHVNYGTDYPTSMKSFIDSNKLRPILIVDQSRLLDYPNVPTIKEVGIDIKLDNWFIIVANSTASPEDIAIMQQAISKTLSNPILQNQLKEFGFKNINAQVPSNFLSLEQQNFIKLTKQIKFDVN